VYLALRFAAARRDQSREAGAALPAGLKSHPALAIACFSRHCPYPRRTDAVVSVAWFVPVTVRYARVPRIIVPRTAPNRFGLAPISGFSQNYIAAVMFGIRRVLNGFGDFGI
jgi:hypothetical protein